MSEQPPPSEGSDPLETPPAFPEPPRESRTQSRPSHDEIDSQKVVRGVAKRITSAAGVDQLEGFSLGEMFSEVFKKHSEQEVEAYFTVGTALTTPSIQDVDTSWPKPWVFFRTFVGAVAVYIGFVFAWREFQNPNLIPGLIIVGAFAIPFSTLIFFFEANVRKNVSLYQVIRLLFLGGILSLIFSLILFEVSSTLSLDWLGASVAGLAEEPGKLLALLLVINNSRYPYTLNGLLFGAAVGTGFAAFESAGYALLAGLSFSNPNVMLDVILLRGIFAPFGHIVWTGMSAAVLWKIKGTQKFRLGMVQDPRFIRVFSIAVVLHMIWNSPLELPLYGKPIILGFIAWVVVLAVLQDGLKQLRVEKRLTLRNEDVST
ncbi:PrsW family glutamic-type intramembrane protease [Acaryochloris sp. IP29b_bin.137]|uniref:PrsW family intramembrane metalloprotease n=1 Tax=Acaryochloris sp. IP29b_bin.137 TaxID=2969217 RepID=UPI00260FEED5|nr:PrsW family glutamic-type intramembrane protease [Acaryochloris sp. IP29b_bin.137]